MPIAFATLSALLDHGFDAVIDVRSPAEYAQDHVPGAINLPALSNEERAVVGTIYKQQSPFAARKIGAAMVARNVAAHVEGPLAGFDGGWRPLVYCWRGGQRSGSFAGILTQIGWRAETIAGGYQSFRRLVHDALYERPLAHQIVLLDGNTGTAKTEVLHRLAAQGLQVIDLEGLARHRGSLLGEQDGGQPSQKGFEAELAVAIARLDPGRPVLIEAESSKIGRLLLPPLLWKAMCAAPRIEITAPPEARARYLASSYRDVAARPDWIAARLNTLRPYRGHAVVDRWLAFVDARAHEALARALIDDHYDPAYETSRRAHLHPVLARVAADDLDAAGIEGLAGAVRDRISQG